MKEFFKTNEGTADRILRIVAGSVGLSLTVVGPKTSWGVRASLALIPGSSSSLPCVSV